MPRSVSLPDRRARLSPALAIFAGLGLALAAAPALMHAEAQAAPATASDAGLPKVGSPAPQFNLPDQDGKMHSLADLRGRRVVLAFYPADMTLGCTAEVCSIRDNLDQLQRDGAAVFGISVQDVSSKRAFADKEHLNFPILADVGGKTAQAYGVLGPKGYAERVTFIIGPDGSVTYIDRALRFDRAAAGLTSSHAAALEMALTPNWHAAVGKPVPSFTLPNYDGTQVTSTDAVSKATVVAFLSVQCPVSNSYTGRLAHLAQDYASQQVRFVGVDSNRGEAPASIGAWAHSAGLPFPVLKDTRNVVADHFQAEHTPEVWVIDHRGVAVYHGAIDDNENEGEVSHHYLADALTAAVAGKAPAVSETRAFGCSIKRAP